MRVVVKIGTSSVTDDRGAIDERAITALAAEIATARAAGHDVVVVSSGAVAAGVAAIAVISVQRVGLVPEQVADTASPSANLVVTVPEDSYIVPTSTNTRATLVPATRLTNYVVAHSEYSSPLGRRSVLSGVLAEDEEVDEPQAAEDADAPNGETNADGSAQVR